MQLTLQLPIECSPEVALVLQETLSQYTNSYNRVCEVGWGMETLNGVELHKLTYYSEREQTDLPAQLVCSARVKATESLKSAKTRLKKKQKASCPNSKSSAIRYDARSATIDLATGTASLASISGRQKVSLKVYQHYQNRMDWKVCSSDLCLHKNKKLYLHVVVEKDIPVSEFKCKKCGFQQNADLNAAKNIRDNHIASKGISIVGGVSSTTLL